MIGKDLAAIFLFGYTKSEWKGKTEYHAEVTCTSYSVNVRNLGNSNGSIVYSEAFGNLEDAKSAIENYFKTFKVK